MTTSHAIRPLVAAFALSISTAAAAADPSVAEGSVQRSDGWITASADGAVYSLPGGTRVRMSAGAEMRFEPVVRLKLAAGAGTTRTQPVRLRQGRLEIDVPAERTASAVMVRGPLGINAVASTGASTIRAAADQMVVAARSSEMLVGAGSEWRPLHAGQVRSFAQTRAPELRGLLGAPSFAPGSTLVTAPAGGATSVDVAWSPMPGASEWAVRVTRRDAGASTPVEQRRTASSAAAFSLAPGAYDVELAGIDADGVESTNVSHRTLRVVGIELPESAVLKASGAIEIGRSQRVRLAGTEGIEVAYGSGSHWIAAPSDLGAARGQRTDYRLRIAGGSDIARITLVPRVLLASVRIGPAAAVWPSDRIQVSVNVTDQAGRPAKPIGIHAQVQVNLDTIDVDWTVNGGTLSAEVPAAKGDGPWVVRVNVADGGEQLAYDFTEVVAAPKRKPARQSKPRATAQR